MRISIMRCRSSCLSVMITMMSIMLPRAGVAAGRIMEILDTKESIHNPRNSATPEKEEKGTVEFDHVSFAYPGAEEGGSF